MIEKPVIFASTCEFSGDMHGEVLIREIRKTIPGSTFFGIGGPKMAEAGVELMFDPTKVSTLGFTEALKNFRRLKRLITEITGEWEKRRPDLMIWLDSGGFNLVLAKEAKKRGIPVVCMFSPSAWAYGEDRAVKLADRVRLLLAVLPFETKFYQKFGVETIYVGHPLLDRVKSEMTPEEFRQKNGLGPEQKLLAIMPGSRRQEVANLLPLMLEAVTEISKDCPVKVMLPIAASINRPWLDDIISRFPLSVRVIDDNAYNLLAAADAAVIASGTATLEAAILNVPTVVIYKVSKLSYFIYKRLETQEHKNKPWISLPNLIAERPLFPEVIQKSLNPANIAKALQPLLLNQEENRNIRNGLTEVRNLIGPPGVMTRAATIIRDLLATI